MEEHESEPREPLSAEQRLAQLEAEAARLRQEMEAAKVSAGAGPTAEAEPAAAAEESSQEPDAPPREISAEDLEEAEKLVRRAHMELQRGNKDFAARYLDEAQQKAPDTAIILEAQGDLAMARSQSKEALELYRRAVERAPDNRALEKKHADLVFRVKAASAGLMLDSPTESYAHLKMASILSAFIPGLGQMAMGDYPRGAAFLVVWIAIIAGVILSRAPAAALSLVGSQNQPVNLLSLTWFLVAFIVWIFAITDLNSRAKMMVRKAKLAAHPDLPEEAKGKQF